MAPIDPKDNQAYLLVGYREACQTKSVNLLRHALDSGLDPNAMEVVKPTTAWPHERVRHILHSAVNTLNAEFVQTLLKAGANPSLAIDEVPNPPATVTPLSRAINARRADIAEMVIAHGENVNQKTHGGWSLVHIATSHHKGSGMACLEVLDRHGVNLDVISDQGKTPLHVSIESPEVFRWLLPRLAHRVNHQDEGGLTPLYEAVKLMDLEAVQALLSHGADPTIPIASGFTPLKLATTLKREDIAHQIESFIAARNALEQIRGIRQANESKNPKP